MTPLDAIPCALHRGEEQLPFVALGEEQKLPRPKVIAG
jgi:hypothetical protein